MTRNRSAGVRTVRVGDTQILTHSRRHRRLHDAYHVVLALSWPQFFLALGLVFARFAKPTARILFSERAVFATSTASAC